MSDHSNNILLFIYNIIQIIISQAKNVNLRKIAMQAKDVLIISVNVREAIIRNFFC